MNNKSHKFFLLPASVIIGYFFLASFIWIINNWQNYSPKKSLLDKYIVNNHQDLEKTVFSQIFDESKKCLLLTNSLNKIECEKKAAFALAETIKEEELIVDKFGDWPHDLFFVLEENDTFYSLDWSGKIENISSKVNRKLINNKRPLIFNYLARKCNFFGILTDSQYACDTFSQIDLTPERKGYLVRMTPLSEETEFTTILFLPFFALTVLLDNFKIK